MKLNFKYFLASLLFATVLVSCNDDEVNYTPKVYVQPPALAVTITNAGDNSFDVNYTAQADGVVYYAIDRSDRPAPDAEGIIRRNAGNMVNAKADLTSGTAWATTISDNIYGAYTYSVYSVMTSTDGIASEVMKTDVTTPDTLDPVFDRPNSSPAHNVQPGTNSPFTTVTLAFSEPVFYQGGDITFNGFFGGRNIVVNNPTNVVSNGVTVTIAVHGTFAQDDAIVVGWAADTFKDNSGKSVAPLTGFGYYFWTREFTVAEKTFLMQGTYMVETIFWGGFLDNTYNANAAFLGPSNLNAFEITLDPEDPSGLTLLGFNVFNAAGGLPIKFKLHPTIDGELDVLPNQTSAVFTTTTGGTTSYEPYSFFGSQFPGFYDFDNGTIQQWNTLVIDATGGAVDDIDYNYTRIGTFDRAIPKDFKNKKEEILNGSQKKDYPEIKLNYNF